MKRIAVLLYVVGFLCGCAATLTCREIVPVDHVCARFSQWEKAEYREGWCEERHCCDCGHCQIRNFERFNSKGKGEK
jgi:hypothetical protein